MTEPASTTSPGDGVDALIARLHQDGVAAGAAEAERLLAAAQAEAAAITASARSEADRMLADATAEADRRRQAGQSALALAARDARLAVREALVDLFEIRLAAMVTDSLADPPLMTDLVRQAAAALTEGGAAHAGIGLDPAVADRLIAKLAGVLAADDIRIAPAPGGPALVVRRSGSGLRLELGEDSLAAMLMLQLRPALHQLLDPGAADGQAA